MFEIVIPLLCLVLLWKWNRSYSSNLYLPQGPYYLPILGNLLDIIKNPHLKLSQWAKVYGKLFHIKLGTRTAIVLSDPQVLREVFSKYVTTGRFKTETYLIISNGSYGLMNSEGEAYREVRRFCFQNLKQLGLGSRTSIESLVPQEAQALVDWIKENMKISKSGLLLKESLTNSVLNTIWTMVTGERVAIDNTKLYMLIHEYTSALQYTVKSGLGFYPWLRHLSPHFSGYNDLKRTADNVRKFIEEAFAKHEESLVRGSPRDLVDCYLEHMLETDDPKSSFYGNVGRINSISSVCELFIASGETVSLTLLWAMFYLCTHETSQEKLTNEVINVVGNNECSIGDRERMPFTDAVILETLRMSSLVPLGLFHETLDEMTYNQYTFPKGTVLIPNMYHIHHDEKIWGDPQNFRPERFLGNESKELRDSMVAFQPGRRVCVGEFMAKDLLFLFLVKLIQNFEIKAVQDVTMEEYLKPDVGLVLLPGENKLIFETKSNLN